MRIDALYRKSITSKPAPGHKIYPYLLRGMTIARPNQVWCMDITYVPMVPGSLALPATGHVGPGRVAHHRTDAKPLECKRLAKSPWKLANEYAVSGVDRFRRNIYSRHHPRAMMAGYVLDATTTPRRGFPKGRSGFEAYRLRIAVAVFWANFSSLVFITMH